MTDEQREAYTKSVLQERACYEAESDMEGVAACNRELERLGASRKPARGTAQQRLAKGA